MLSGFTIRTVLLFWELECDMPTPGNPRSKVSPGQTLKSIPREVYNGLLGLLDGNDRASSNQLDGSIPADTWSPTIVRVRNQSGGTIPRHGVIEIDGAPIPGNINGPEYKRYCLVDGVTPTGTEGAPVAITLEPILNGEIGRAVISGMVVATVNVINEDHTRCEAATSTGHLITSEDGPIEIVHLSDPVAPGANRLAYVLLSKNSTLTNIEIVWDENTPPSAEPLDIGQTASRLDFVGESGVRAQKITDTPGAVLIDLLPADLNQWGVVTDDDQHWYGIKEIQGVITGSPRITDGVIILDDDGTAASHAMHIVCDVVYAAGVQNYADFRLRHYDNVGAIINTPFVIRNDDEADTLTIEFLALAGGGAGQGNLTITMKKPALGQPSTINIDGENGYTGDATGGTYRAGLLVSASGGSGASQSIHTNSLLNSFLHMGA